MISNRANSAIVEAEFFIPFEYQPKPLQSFTDGLDHFFISRKIQRDKPSQARINGERVALKSLKDITPFCLQLTSQHDTQQLFDENFQKNLYDHYVGDVLLPLKKTFKSILETFKQNKQALQKLQDELSTKEQRIEFLKFQIHDIEQHHFEENEDETLNQERKTIRSQKERLSLIRSAQSKLSLLKNESDGLIDDLTGLSDIDDDYAPFLSNAKIGFNRIR